MYEYVPATSSSIGDPVQATLGVPLAGLQAPCPLMQTVPFWDFPRCCQNLLFPSVLRATCSFHSYQALVSWTWRIKPRSCKPYLLSRQVYMLQYLFRMRRSFLSFVRCSRASARGISSPLLCVAWSSRLRMLTVRDLASSAPTTVIVY